MESRKASLSPFTLTRPLIRVVYRTSTFIKKLVPVVNYTNLNWFPHTNTLWLYRTERGVVSNLLIRLSVENRGLPVEDIEDARLLYLHSIYSQIAFSGSAAFTLISCPEVRSSSSFPKITLINAALDPELGFRKEVVGFWLNQLTLRIIVSCYSDAR